MKDYSLLKKKIKLIEASAVSLEEHMTELFENGYDQGCVDGQKEKLANAMIHDHEVAEKTAYEQGLNDSWECARKMCLMSPEERLRTFDVSGNHLAILSDLTASQCIEKVKAYQRRKIYSNHTAEEIAESFIKDVSAVKDQLPKHNCEDCKRTKDPIFYGHCVGECDYAKQTEDIKVGDEITSYTDTNNLVIGIGVWGEWHCITAYGAGFEITKEKQKYWKKTGRHFDQINEVLEEMGDKE